MNGYTAEEYKRAAEMLREFSEDADGGARAWSDELSTELTSKAQRMEQLAELVKTSVEAVKTWMNDNPNPYSLPDNAWHMKMAAILMDSGWTPPNGMF